MKNIVTDANTLIQNKITAPLLPPTIIHRASLIQKLDQVMNTSSPDLSYKIVLLCAPAGYGKTTLLSSFSRNSHTPCCWYFLDSADMDRATFLHTLLASIRQRFPQFGKALDPWLADLVQASASLTKNTYSPEKIMDLFLTAMEEEITEHFALFLCNYHEVNQSNEINALVNRWLERSSTRCVLVIESRAIPRLEFGPLIIQRKIVGLGRNILRFTPQEVQDLAFCQGLPSLSKADAEQLATSFDGWIAGILLGTRLGEIPFLDPSFSPETHPSSLVGPRNQKRLFAYLVKEVFQHEAEAYLFLKDIVILQYMTSTLCNDLLHTHDSAERLQYLEQQGFFVTRSGEGQEAVYTCHALLRELLCEELRQRSPEHFTHLHQQAAALFQAHSEYEQAIYHALQAAMEDWAQSIIMEAQEKMFANGCMEALARWIDILLAKSTPLHPRLLLTRAKIHFIFGQYAQTIPLFEAASKAAIETNGSCLSTLQAEIILLQSRVLFQKGDYAQVQVLCQQIMANLPVDDVPLQAEAHLHLGTSANLLGDFPAGIVHLQRALQLWGRETKTRQTADVHSALASTYGLIGNFALAEHHLARAISCWDYLHIERGKADSLIRMGVIKHYQGEAAEAETYLKQALALSRGSLHFSREEAYTLVSLGELYQDQGSYGQALHCLDEGLALARQMEDRYLINYALCTLAMTYLFIGDSATALLLISGIDLGIESNAVISYERVLRDLAYGTILFYKGEFDEAYSCLSLIEKNLCQMGLWREQLQITLRIAACQLAQGKRVELIARLENVGTRTKQDNAERFITSELHRLPALENFVKTAQEAMHIRTCLNIRSEYTEAPDSPEIVPLQRQPSSASSPSFSSRPKLSIRALGDPMVTLDGRPVERWHLARAMELFFFLLDSGRPVHKEQIMAALWPDAQSQIEQALRTNVYYARKVLGEEAIVYRSHTYELRISPLYEVQYDITSFQECYASAKKILEDEEDISQARNALLKTVDFYQGDYVQSFYSDWCILRRRELRRIYLDARHHLARITLEQGRFDESLTHYQQMLIVDNCLEEAHYGLMRCYLRQGKRGLALRQYQRCATNLNNELGVEPGSHIQNLYQRLIASPEQ